MWRIWTRGWGPRDWWYWFRYEGFPLWIASHLPARVVYWCFIRVHGAGEIDWTFKEISDNWFSKHHLN